MDNNFDILKDISEEFNSETIETKKETIFENSSLTNSFNDDTLLDDIILERTESIEEKKESNLSFFNSFKFLIKYLITSTAIFFLLLISTNYSAYINIANSYINKDKMEETKNSLINSVAATNININTSETITVKTKEVDIINDSFKKFVDTKNENPSLDISITPYENRIIIPKIWKNIPLVEIKNRTVSGQSELNDIFMQELQNWVIRYPGSAKPGEEWNSFIFWHSSNFPWIKWEFNDVFALLDKITYDDDIIVYYNQKKYIYKIKKKNVITPGNVSVLKPKNKSKELSIMTCWPIWTTLNRLVVTWELVEKQ